MIGVRIPEVSESEEVLDYSVGELCCRKENGGQCQAEKVFDAKEFEKNVRKKRWRMEENKSYMENRIRNCMPKTTIIANFKLFSCISFLFSNIIIFVMKHIIPKSMRIRHQKNTLDGATCIFLLFHLSLVIRSYL